MRNRWLTNRADSATTEVRTMPKRSPQVDPIAIGPSAFGPGEDPMSALAASALDDVVNREFLGRPRELDPRIGQDRDQPLTKRLELLSRVPDLADTQIPI